MESVKVVFDTVVFLFKIPFTIYGFTISLWQMIIYVLLGSFALWLVVKIFNFGG